MGLALHGSREYILHFTSFFFLQIFFGREMFTTLRCTHTHTHKLFNWTRMESGRGKHTVLYCTQCVGEMDTLFTVLQITNLQITIFVCYTNKLNYLGGSKVNSRLQFTTSREGTYTQQFVCMLGDVDTFFTKNYFYGKNTYNHYHHVRNTEPVSRRILVTGNSV